MRNVPFSELGGSGGDGGNISSIAAAIAGGSMTPDAIETIIRDLVSQAAAAAPDKAASLKSKLAAAVGLGADADEPTLVDKLVSWAKEHPIQAVAAILAIVALVVGTAFVIKWWRERRSQGDAAAEQMQVLEPQVLPAVDGLLASYASRSGGDGNPATIWGQSANALDPARLEEAFEAIDLLKSYFGNLRACRALVEAIRGLELEHFDVYAQLRGR